MVDAPILKSFGGLTRQFLVNKISDFFRLQIFLLSFWPIAWFGDLPQCDLDNFQSKKEISDFPIFSSISPNF